MALLDESIRNELKEIFKELDKKVYIKLFISDKNCLTCSETKTLYTEISELTEKIKFELGDETEVKNYNLMDMRPVTIILDENKKDYGIRFYGIVAGYEFSSFLETILLVSTGKHQLKDSSIKFIKSLPQNIDFKIFVTTSCPYCPAAVYIGHSLAYLSDNKITSNMIEVSEFPELGNKYNVMGVPRTVINDSEFQEGAAPEEVIIEKIKKVINNPTPQN
ncbi:MAG: thioredoxin family protein [Deltaproteobacteria bacterium]|nr:thioredoxin family protein [Deltaproteobacteria bacterium]